MGPLGSYLLMDDSRCKRCTGVATIVTGIPKVDCGQRAGFGASHI